MSENSRRFIKAMYALDAVAKRVPDNAWDNPSCCEGWTAREVAGHASSVLTTVGALAGAHARPEPQPEADIAGQEPAAVIAAAVAGTAAALDTQGALQTVAETPLGEMPLDRFLGLLWVDPLTHAWDIADATGVEHGLDAHTATEAYESLLPASDALRGPGRFAEPVEPKGPDEVSRLVAFTGRRSVRH